MKSSRSQNGMNLIEMMVALAITGIAVAGLSEIGFLSTDWIDKFSNKVDVSVAAKRALENIGLDVRCARNLGDYAERHIVKPAVFPSADNPLYKAGLPSGALSSYSLSDTTLIIQKPVLDRGGWPTLLPTSIDSSHGPNVDTIIYEVVQDPDSPSNGPQQYLLRRTVFIGKHDSEVTSEFVGANNICPGVPILKGIVGPLDKSSGKPVVFQALDQTTPGATPVSFDTVTSASIPLISGVVINVEVLRTQSATKNAALCAFRSEIMFRNKTIVE
jgi:prepilin-type N-terminal cleavage/methylation domain-containing protein